MKLYEINDQMSNLMERIFIDDPENAVDSINAVAELETLQLQFNEKAENICKYTRNLESHIESIDSEIARLTALKKSKTNKVESLEQYLRFSMQKLGVNELDLGIFKVKLSPSYAMKVEDISLIPTEYIKSSIILDNQSIKDYDKILASLKTLGIEVTPERKVMLAEVKKWFQELDPAQRESLQDKVFLQTNYNLKIK